MALQRCLALVYIVHLVILSAPLAVSHRLTYLWSCAHGVSIGGITLVRSLPAAEHLFVTEIVRGKLEVSAVAYCMIPWYHKLERDEGHYEKLRRTVGFQVRQTWYTSLSLQPFRSFLCVCTRPHFHSYDLFRLNNYHFFFFTNFLTSWTISCLHNHVALYHELSIRAYIGTGLQLLSMILQINVASVNLPLHRSKRSIRQAPNLSCSPHILQICNFNISRLRSMCTYCQVLTQHCIYFLTVEDWCTKKWQFVPDSHHVFLGKYFVKSKYYLQ